VTHRGPCQPPPCWDSVIRATTTSARQLRHNRTRETCSQQTRPMTRIAGVSDSAAPENRVAGTDSSGCPDSGGRRVRAGSAPAICPVSHAHRGHLHAEDREAGREVTGAWNSSTAAERALARKRIQYLAARNSNFWSADSSCQRCCSSKTQQNEPRN